MEAAGFIKSVDKDYVKLLVPLEGTSFIEKENITQARVIFTDARLIRPDQRKKIYAIIHDISDWNGDTPEELLKDCLKTMYLEKTGGEWFSLSDCTVSDAREFINFLIDFCFMQNIPTRDTMLNRTDDISKYLYCCIENRKCCICNGKAEIHHCEGSCVGMGFNRNSIDNIGRSAIALCRKHHAQAHNGENKFFEKYHIYGTKLDEYLIKKLKL